MHNILSLKLQEDLNKVLVMEVELAEAQANKVLREDPLVPLASFSRRDLLLLKSKWAIKEHLSTHTPMHLR